MNERGGNVTVVRPTADIDASNASELRESLTSSVGADVDHLIVDLSLARYVDSAGLDMLFRLAERLRQRRARLMIVIPADSQLVRVAEIVGLARAMEVFETVDEAVGACTPAEQDEAGCVAGETPGKEG